MLQKTVKDFIGLSMRFFSSPVVKSAQTLAVSAAKNHPVATGVVAVGLAYRFMHSPNGKLNKEIAGLRVDLRALNETLKENAGRKP
jgi:hypothetical protein